MKDKRIKGRNILITIGAVALFWILESVVMVRVFQEGNFVEQMFSSDPHEIWMRSLAMGIIIAFGVYAQFSVTRQNRVEHDLQERVKELQCLYGIAEVAERTDISSDKLYQEVVNLLPSSWQYPEITCARTIIDNKEFKTKNCRDTEWKQSSDIKVHGAKVGTVEVGYLEERPKIDEGPFLKEERLLIDAIAEQLARITERKQAEEELRKTYQELRDTHVQLLQAGKMASMGEMAAGVAHELTQPLLGIKGFATAMLDDMKPYLPTETSVVPDTPLEMERAVKDIEVILQQTDRMGTIVNNVRQFARESGTDMVLLDVNKPIEDALMLFSEQLRVHNIVAEKNLVAGLPRVMGNANQLQQVFINLITNARDAMDAKDGKGQLMVSTGACPGGVYAEVEDTGIGADAETISKMFEPFVTTKTNGKSTGLGLSIVTGIIEEHGGTIDVRSEPGRGCKFTITLPPGAEEEDD